MENDNLKNEQQSDITNVSCRYSYAIVGRFKINKDIAWSKHGKYITLESAEQALKDMSTGVYDPVFEFKIVPYFTGRIYID